MTVNHGVPGSSPGWGAKAVTFRSGFFYSNNPPDAARLFRSRSEALRLLFLLYVSNAFEELHVKIVNKEGDYASHNLPRVKRFTVYCRSICSSLSYTYSTKFLSWRILHRALQNVIHLINIRGVELQAPLESKTLVGLVCSVLTCESQIHHALGSTTSAEITVGHRFLQAPSR